MFKLHQQIELTEVLTGGIGDDLRLGDTGDVVEFLNLDGSKSVIGTVLPHQVRPVTGKDITHTRHVEITA
ncbi:MAG: hypothetical protein OXU21_05920 [Chloroflexota bacterium]|nr:hypothetical protein [Chloroflexota bacterium]